MPHTATIQHSASMNALGIGNNSQNSKYVHVHWKWLSLLFQYVLTWTLVAAMAAEVGSFLSMDGMNEQTNDDL